MSSVRTDSHAHRRRYLRLLDERNRFWPVHDPGHGRADEPAHEKKMQIQLVVTQHRTLVELLLERGVIDNTTPVIEHVSPDDIRGMHVLGVLPHHLSSLAASYAEVPIRFADAAERRSFAGGDIPLERLRQIADKPVTYTVRRDSGRFLQWHDSNLDRLPETEREGWRRAVAMTLELALPPEEHNDGENMERARSDAHSARRNLEREITRELQHREDLRRIKEERCAEQAKLTIPPASLSRAEIEKANGTLLNIVGRVLKMKRIRHDIGAQESDDQYRARLLAELDRRGCTGVQLDV